jgi:hypothetical protein
MADSLSQLGVCGDNCNSTFLQSPLTTALAAVCAALAFSCASSSQPSASSWVDSYADIRLQCVAKIDSLRATIGLPALTFLPAKDTCSDDEARNDCITGVAHGAFGQCGEMAQNECPGYGSTGSIVDGCLTAMWDEGPGQPYSQHGHYINMTNTAYTKVSVGFYAASSGSVWAVFNFYP